MSQHRRLVLAALLHAAITIAIALVGGGWWGLGRADPLFAVPGLGWASVMMWWACPSIGWRSAALSGLTTAALCTFIAAAFGLGSSPWLQAVMLVLVSAGVATICVHVLGKYAWRYAALRRRRWLSLGVLTLGLPILVLTLASRIVPPLYAMSTRADGPRIALLTSLPLTSERGDVAAVLAGEVSEEPALALLRQRFRVMLVDSVDPAVLANADLLLLAHPRALAPQQLVTIDDWVRSGGKAMILADGLSSWEPPHPIGDPRNPPLTSLLTPLLTHWELTLDAPAGLVAREEAVMDGAQRLRLFSPGRLHSAMNGCQLAAETTIADCRIGRGRAIIVADADWLRARHWGGAGKAGVGTPANWRSGNMVWLANQLDALAGQESDRAWAGPVWTR